MKIEGGHLISIITSVCAFLTGALSIYLGYKLFILKATGSFEISISIRGFDLSFISWVPGLGFALFGMVIAWKALSSLIKK